jgi:PAS domain S-box-containing protein
MPRAPVSLPFGMTTAPPTTAGSERRPRSRRLRYALAASSVGVALLATLALQHPEIRGPLFIPAILLSAWYGGVRPGLLAVGLSTLAISYFLTPPQYSLRLISLDDALYVAVFALSALLVAWLTGAQRRVERALLQTQDELTARMRDLEGANARLEAEIVERARMAAEVQKQASLLDLTHDTIFVRDAGDVITFWNRGAEERYGWTGAEARGQVSHRLLRTVFPAPIEEIEAELHRTERWEGELVHTTRDGTPVVVASRWSLQRDDRGRPAGVLETNNDVTARRRAEEALRRQANLLEQTHDAIFVWELGGAITYWNLGAENLYGFSREEAIGRVSHDLLRTRHPMPTAAFEATVEREGSWAGELTHTTRDGRGVVVDSRQVLMHEGDGRRLVLETNRDVTARKRAEAARDEARAALANVTRLSTLGEITASIAHEVNQPLAAVVMNGNACRRWLATEPPNVAEARQAAERVVSDGTRAGQVIARVRALVRGGAPERRPLDVNDVIRESLAVTRDEAERWGASLRAELQDDLPPVAADRVQVQQVLVNLILNGVEAMADVADGPARVLTVRSRREGPGAVRVEVADHGKGLDPEHPNRIFDAFFSTKPGGLGLGLSISRSIVEAHGGRIWATPNDGPGATVVFTLPDGAGGG